MIALSVTSLSKRSVHLTLQRVCEAGVPSLRQPGLKWKERGGRRGSRSLSLRVIFMCSIQYLQQMQNAQKGWKSMLSVCLFMLS